MKKVIPILLAFFIMLTSTCFAAYTPDPNRWTWIYSNDIAGTFWDKTTAQYTNSGNTAEFWVCEVYPQENGHVISKCKITKQPRTYTELQYTSYNSSTREVIKSKTYSSYEQKAEYIHPDSWEEKLYEAAFSVKYPKIKERLNLLYEGNNMFVSLDTATIEYSNNGNIATYWVLCIDSKNVSKSLWIYEQINKSARTNVALYIVPIKGDPLTPPKEYKKIIPDSNGETLFNAVFPN